MSPEEIARIIDRFDIKSNPVFSTLNATQVNNFVAASSPKSFGAGDEIITRGNIGENVYFLLEGELSVRLPGNRHSQELAHLTAPAVVGEMEMLTRQPRSATVVALTPVSVLAMPIDVLQARIDDGDAAALKVVGNIARVVANRLSTLVEKMHELEGAVSEERSLDLKKFRTKLFSDWST